MAFWELRRCCQEARSCEVASSPAAPPAVRRAKFGRGSPTPQKHGDVIIRYMYTPVSVPTSLFLSIRVSVSLCVCVSLSLSLCPSVSVSFRLSRACLSIYPHVCLLCMNLHACTYPCVYVHLYVLPTCGFMQACTTKGLSIRLLR